MFDADSQRYASMFAALGHPARVRIVRELLRAFPGGLVVGDIQERLDLPGSTLSHHLDALRRVGLIDQQREGRFLRYRAADQGLTDLLGFLYAECCGRSSVVQISALEAAPAASATDDSSGS